MANHQPHHIILCGRRDETTITFTSLDMTMGDLKQCIREQYARGENLMLKFEGLHLTVDSTRLRDCGIENGSLIQHLAWSK